MLEVLIVSKVEVRISSPNFVLTHPEVAALSMVYYWQISGHNHGLVIGNLFSLIAQLVWRANLLKWNLFSMGPASEGGSGEGLEISVFIRHKIDSNIWSILYDEFDLINTARYRKAGF